MFRISYKLLTVWGIPIKLHISLLFLMIWMALQALAEGLGFTGVLTITLICVAAFTSIALHELGHSFVAIRKGCRVRSITLMFMGGVAQMENVPKRPRDEFLMAIAGPCVSLVIGLTVGTVGYRILLESWQQRSVFLQTVGWAVAWIGIWNLFLTVFNLLPAFPMDGGRVLRSMLAPRIGHLRATRIASRCGKGVACLFGLIGFTGIPGTPFGPNLILVIIGIFIFIAAGREYRAALWEHRAQGWPFPDGVPPDIDNDHTVEIGPPPYEQDRSVRTPIRPLNDERRGPFDRF